MDRVLIAPGDSSPSAADGPPRLLLDETLDLAAAGPLRAAFLDRRGHDLAVDASGVFHLGAQCAQVLAAAAAAWAADGASLRFAEPSEAFRRGARLLGLRHVLTPAPTPAVDLIPASPESDEL